MDMEYKHGKTAQSMKEVGKITKNMVKVHIQIKMENPKAEFGMKEKEKKGLIRIKRVVKKVIKI